MESLFDKKYNNSDITQDDKILLARIDDLVIKSEKTYSSCFTYFLDERQIIIAERHLKSRKIDNFSFYGGYENAKRKILAINIKSGSLEIENFPIKCLTFTYRIADKLTHRDFLGSLMALRLRRELIGDIVISEGKTQIFVTETASKCVLNELTKIGKIGVKIDVDTPFEIKFLQEFETITGTVASMRLDNVVSLCTKLSREKSSQLISIDGVKVNFTVITNSSKQINCGDVLSIRGYGRFNLSKIAGVSKSGRLHLRVEKYK